MIEFSKNKVETKYTRKIESMGKGLVLFKIGRTPNTIGQNYHLFYGDKRKPPMDIAIQPQDNMVEYISFFLQDEKIILKEDNLNVKYKDEIILMFDNRFSIDTPYIEEQKELEIIIKDKDIYAIEKGVNDEIIACKIDNSNYVLINNKGNVCGVALINLLEAELEEIRNSECI